MDFLTGIEDDDVLAAAGDVDVALAVYAADVAGAEPVADLHRPCFLLSLPVAGRDVVAVDGEFALIVKTNVYLLLRHIDQAHLDAGKRLPDCAQLPLVVVGEPEPAGIEALPRNDGRRLGKAPSLDDKQSEKVEVAGSVRVKSSTTAGQEAQVAAQPGVDLPEYEMAKVNACPLLDRGDEVQGAVEGTAPPLRLGLSADGAEHEVVHRRYAAKEGGVRLRHAIADADEVVLENDGRSHHHREEELNRERVAVMHRQHQQHSVLRANRHHFGDSEDVGDEVAMGEHDPFGTAGGAGGEDDGGQVVGPDDGGSERGVAFRCCLVQPPPRRE